MARLLPVFRLAALLVAAFFPFSLPAAEAERLVPANFNNIADRRGNRWDVNQMGAVSDGTNDCFDNGMVLQLDGNQVSFGRPMMTADGLEYVFTTRHRQMNVTRRVRLDAEKGIMRYMEIFESTGGSPQRVQATIHTDLGNNFTQALDLKDKQFTGVLGKDDGAFITFGDNSRPGVVFVVADPKAKAKPQVRLSNNRSIDVVYAVDLPKGGTQVFVHYVAQRMNGSTAEARDVLAAVYKRGRLIDPTLPKAFEKLIVNFSAGRPVEIEDKASPLLAPLQQLVEAAEITRGKLDTVLLDAGAKLAGTVTGGDFEIETLFGKLPVAFADVAGVEGGASVLRPIRVFLRNGEILTGEVANAKMAMTTESGLNLDLDFAQISFLALRTAEGDGIATPNARALITSERGDRLALSDGAAPLEVATPWGMTRVPLTEVRTLATVREPFPAHRLTLMDRSQFIAMLRGTEWSAPSLRFGPIKMAPQSIREVQGVSAPVAEPAEGEPEAAAAPGQPICELVGESRLAGIIDLPVLHLVVESSVTPLESKQIVQMEAETNEAGERVVTIKLADGQELKGRLTENIIPIRAGERVWHVPLPHLVAYRTPKAESAGEKPAEGAKPKTAGSIPPPAEPSINFNTPGLITAP